MPDGPARCHSLHSPRDRLRVDPRHRVQIGDRAGLAERLDAERLDTIAGVYRGVYPVKVNQQRHIVEEVVEFGAPPVFEMPDWS